MQGTTGIVTSIDRANHQCRVQVLGSASGAALSLPAKRPILYPKYRGVQPPPPLSYVDLDQVQPGVWRIAGTVAHRRELVHDDFSIATDPALGVARGMGDTSWRLTNISAYAYGQLGGTNQGVGLLVSNAGAGAVQGIAKDDLAYQVTSDPALWFSSRFGTSTPTLGAISCGFGSPDTYINGGAATISDTAATFLYDGNVGNAQLFTANGIFQAVVNTPYVVSASVYFDIDIIIVGDVFVALWINGDGPYIQSAAGVGLSVPLTAQPGYEPYFSVKQNGAGAADIRMDVVHVETVTPIANPLRDLIVPGGGFVA